MLCFLLTSCLFACVLSFDAQNQPQDNVHPEMPYHPHGQLQPQFLHPRARSHNLQNNPDHAQRKRRHAQIIDQRFNEETINGAVGQQEVVVAKMNKWDKEYQHEARLKIYRRHLAQSLGPQVPQDMDVMHRHPLQERGGIEVHRRPHQTRHKGFNEFKYAKRRPRRQLQRMRTLATLSPDKDAVPDDMYSEEEIPRRRRQLENMVHPAAKLEAMHLASQTTEVPQDQVNNHNDVEDDNLVVTTHESHNDDSAVVQLNAIEHPAAKLHQLMMQSHGEAEMEAANVTNRMRRFLDWLI